MQIFRKDIYYFRINSIFLNPVFHYREYSKIETLNGIASRFYPISTFVEDISLETSMRED